MASPYTSPALSGFNATPPSDDGSTVAANQLTWQKHLDKLATPLKTYADAINTNVQLAFTSIYGQTAAEISAGVTPTNYQYPPGHILRYGTNTTPGTTDLATAVNNAILVMEANGGGDVVLPSQDVLVGTSITLKAGVNIVGHGETSRVVADDCNGIVLGFTTAFGQVVLRDFHLDGANGTTRIGIYQTTLDDTEELYGVKLSNLLITNFHKLVSTRTVRQFWLESVWGQHCNQALDLIGKNLVVRILGCTFVKGNSNGTTTGGGLATSDNIGLLLDLFNFTAGSGNVGPEGVIIHASQIYGFDIAVQATFANYVAIGQYDFDARVYGIEFETVQQGLSIRDGTIVMQTTAALAAIKGNGLASPIAARVRIHANDIVGVTSSNCIGIQINDSGNSNQDHISIRDNYFSDMGVNDILLNNAGPGMVVESNRCNSSSPTNSISVPNVATGGKVFIAYNHCLKAINVNAAELANGEVILGPNVTGDSTFAPANYALFQTEDTRTGAGAVSLTTRFTNLITDGANALTLADGFLGQEKIIHMITFVGDGTLTPANLFNGNTITFNAVGDTVHLRFCADGEWHVIQNSGCDIA